MAMIEARKGKHTILVSKRAYETMFKDKGYFIVGKQRVDANSMMNDEHTYSGYENKEEADETTEHEKEHTEMEEIPISEMTKDQLQEYAIQHDIDTSSAKNVREARTIIQKAIREANI